MFSYLKIKLFSTKNLINSNFMEISAAEYKNSQSEKKSFLFVILPHLIQSTPFPVIARERPGCLDT